MGVKALRSGKQHRAALSAIERLWAAKPGSPGHRRLEGLATLVDDWEEKHQPVYPPGADAKASSRGNVRRGRERS